MQKNSENSQELKEDKESFRKIYWRYALASGVPCAVIMGAVMAAENGLLQGVFIGLFCGFFFGMFMAVRPATMQGKAEAEKRADPAAEIEGLKFMRLKAYALLAVAVPYVAYRSLTGITISAGLENLDLLLALLLVAVELWDIRSSGIKIEALKSRN